MNMHYVRDNAGMSVYINADVLSHIEVSEQACNAEFGVLALVHVTGRDKPIVLRYTNLESAVTMLYGVTGWNMKRREL